MLEHIGTDIISTIIPRAKGRIERLWRTFQDRLYKELKKKHITTIEEANRYLNDVFIPKYNARFAPPIDNNKNHFICLDDNFDYNVELAAWSKRKVYHNSYLKYDNCYHVILDKNQKSYIPTSGKVKVYTFLDGSTHVLFNDKFYHVKTVKDFQSKIKKVIQTSKSKTEINLSKAHKPTNSPWRKGFPPVVTHNAMYYTINHGC